MFVQEAGETALHHCVRTADQSSLHLVDFLVQNRCDTPDSAGSNSAGCRSVLMCVCVCVCVCSGNLDGQTDGGNTALHYCCLYNKPQCVKLLLRGKPDLHISKNTHPCTHTRRHTHVLCIYNLCILMFYIFYMCVQNRRRSKACLA